MKYIVWGRNTAYCANIWLKLGRNTSQKYIEERKSQGFEVVVLPVGKHPEGNQESCS